jgi:hypothetical protein
MGKQGSLTRRRPDDARQPVHLPALIGATMRPDPPQWGRITNLSRGGLALQLQAALPAGTPVRITLQTGHRPLLTWLGRVVWLRQADQAGAWVAGVGFTTELTGDLVTDITVDAASDWAEPPDAEAAAR